MKLKSIKQEVADCRKAFKDVEIGTFVQLCHHGVLIEILEKPAENRIQYIMKNKLKEERALRLRMFRPWIWEIPEKLNKTRSEYNKAYREYYKTNSEYDKARSEYYKTRSEYNKAYREYYKTNSEYDKARSEYYKTNSEYDKAYREYYKTYSEYNKAYRECMPELENIHRKYNPDSPWNGYTIFGSIL